MYLFEVVMGFVMVSIGIFILAMTFCLVKGIFTDIDISHANNAHNVQVLRLETR